MELDIDGVIEKLGNGMGPHRINQLVENAPDESLFITNQRHPQHGQLSVVELIDLGDGDGERISQSILDASNNLSLILQASGFSNDESQPQGADDHGHKKSRRSWAEL
jgi:hypothetical protein